MSLTNERLAMSLIFLWKVTANNPQNKNVENYGAKKKQMNSGRESENVSMGALLSGLSLSSLLPGQFSAWSSLPSRRLTTARLFPWPP
jgi:hypothetical protein